MPDPISFEKRQFHSLDALRFFAFFKVFLFHIPNREAFPYFKFISGEGGLGVSFFFVLSGFLITYILWSEKFKKGKLNAKRFFVRRAFRIWPLYFLVLGIVFLIPLQVHEWIGWYLDNDGYDPQWWISFTFLEPYKMLGLDQFPKIAPLPVMWTICVEEHFYITWMLLVLLLPAKTFGNFLWLAIGMAWIARLVYPLVFEFELIREDLLTNLDYFAVGSMLGIAVAQNFQKLSARIEKIPRIYPFLFTVFSLIAIVLYSGYSHYLQDRIWQLLIPTFFAAVFCLLILFLLPQHSPLRLRNTWLNYLGKISYGLYVFHLLIIHSLHQWCVRNNCQPESHVQLLFFIVVALLLTTIVSAISYQFFERPVLRIRDRF